MKKIFKIGEFCFCLDYSDDIVIPKNFMLFEVEHGNIEFTFNLMISEYFPNIEGIIIAKRNDLIVLQTQFGESRFIGIKGREGYYACYNEIDDTHANVYIDLNSIQKLNIDPVFTSLFALEKHLLKKSQMILHCAYVKYKDEAILFSAPSETGKTTQANLWEEYLGSQTINGDRALLGYENNKWIAHGWPVCGTSGVCNNINTPIKAIVMLSQGKEDSVEQISPAKAFSLLYSQITINRWNNSNHIQIINLIEQLIQNVPIYHLSCTISKNAVMCLKNAIYDI